MASEATKQRVRELLALQPSRTPVPWNAPVSADGGGKNPYRKTARRIEKRQKIREQVEQLKAIEEFKAESGGGFNPVAKAIEALDYPRRGVFAAAAGLAYLGNKAVGADERAEFSKDMIGESLSGEFRTDDILEDMGVENKYVKGGLGFVGDVATDPITYVAPYALLRGGPTAVARNLMTKGVQRVAAQEVGEGALERGAIEALESGGREAVERAAMEAARRRATAEIGPVAAKVSREGGSSMSSEQMLRYLGNKGGLKMIVPGTGRLGRKLTGATQERTFTLLPKQVTDPVAHSMAGLRTTARESKLGKWALQRLGGEEYRRALQGLAQGGSPDLFYNAMRTAEIAATENSRAAARFRDLLHEYAKDVRPKIKRQFDDVVEAVERGDWTNEGAVALRDFFAKIRGVADEVGLVLPDDPLYQPLIMTEAGRKARVAKGLRGATGRSYDPTSKSKLRALFGSGEARREFEQFARDELHMSADFFEKHPDKIVPAYMQALERRFAKELSYRRMAEEGILQKGVNQAEMLVPKRARKANRLAEAIARSGVRQTEMRGKADDLATAHGEAVQRVLTNAGRPIAGPAVVTNEAEDLTALLADSTAAHAAVSGVAHAPFQGMSVRQLRRIAKDQGIVGADRMNTTDIVDALATKAAAGTLRPRPTTDDALKRLTSGVKGIYGDDVTFRAVVFENGLRRSAYASRRYDEAVDALDAVGIPRELWEDQRVLFVNLWHVPPGKRGIQGGIASGSKILDDVDRAGLRVFADVDDSNQRLVRMYERVGFTHIDDDVGAGFMRYMVREPQPQRWLAKLDADEIIEEYPRLAGPQFRAAAAAKLDVGSTDPEVLAAARLMDLIGTRSASHMVRPAIDPTMLEFELRLANHAAATADDALRRAVNKPDTLIEREIAALQKERVRYLTEAKNQADKDLRKVAVLEARRAQAEAQWLAESARGQRIEHTLKNLKVTRVQKRFADELIAGTHKFIDEYHNLIGQNEIVDALNAASRFTTPETMTSFLGYYDKVLNYIKAWQISTPGFHVRNTFGGVFNNFLADVDPGAYNRYWRARSGHFTNDADREAFTAWREISSPGQYGSHEVKTGLQHEQLMTRINPLSSKNAYVHVNQRLGGQVEDMLRGSLFMDVYKKTGGDVDAALDAVYKYHFNYDDLSAIEQNVMRRIFPFYTWTRKNFPLQVQMMLERPGKYAWWNHFAENMHDNLGMPDNVVPSYYGDLWAIPTGFHQGDSQMYLTPDLPFTRTMSEALPIEDGRLSANPILSQMTPIIKTPIERAMRHQFFKGIPLTDRKTDFPDPWDEIPGLRTALQHLNVVDKKGQIAEDDAYTIDQYLPFLARLRRLFPSEDKFQDRATSTWLSFVGVPLRTNTDGEKRAERFRRKLEETQPLTIRVPK